MNYEFQKEPGGPWINPVGNFNAQFTDDFNNGGPVFRYRQILALNWDMNAYSASLMYQLSSSYRDANSAAGILAPTTTTRRALPGSGT